MEPRFENRFTRTVEVEKELFRHNLLMDIKSIVFYILIAVVAVANIFLMLFFGVDYLNIISLALCVFCIVIRPIQYSRAIKLATKRMEELYHKKALEVSTTLTDDELISISSDLEKPMQISLTRIRKVFVTEHYYMLRSDAKIVYIFRKGCFTVGREEEFIPFVNQIIAQNKVSRS